MQVPIGQLIGITSRIAEYFGLIEDVNTQIKKLLHQAFNAAKMNLEYARNSSGQNQIDYIKQAQVEFTQAVAVEENENKILALVGLAMCQNLLGDYINADSTYNRINDIELSRSEHLKYIVKDVPFLFLRLNVQWRGTYNPILNSWGERVRHFEQVKNKALNIRNTLLKEHKLYLNK